MGRKRGIRDEELQNLLKGSGFGSWIKAAVAKIVNERITYVHLRGEPLDDMV